MLGVVFFAISLFLLQFVGASPEATTATWIWTDKVNINPPNQFTYFRRVFELNEVPEEVILHFAADSTAHLWVNGIPLRRKVTRYREDLIRTEVVNATSSLVKGANVIVVLHHNWGDIITFQRTGNKHAGLFLNSDLGIVTDSSWKYLIAPQFYRHYSQIIGVTGDHRIRYPQIIYGQDEISGDIHDPSFDDSDWDNSTVINDGPWPALPLDVETPGQAEEFSSVMNVLAAGEAHHGSPFFVDPYSIAEGIVNSTCLKDDQLTLSLNQSLAEHQPLRISGRRVIKFITFDFQRPVHGYPYIEIEGAVKGVVIDFGYTEKALSQFDGSFHVTTDGWVNTIGVVGKGYADRFILGANTTKIELPDERTMRWLTLHIWFHSQHLTEISITKVGIIESQFPISYVGTFDCGDEQIAQIIQLCQIHARVSMSDSYVDCPGREDGQWIEDARMRAVLSSRWFNDSSLRLVLLRSIIESQQPSGNTHGFPPSNYPFTAPFDWSIQWVATLHDQYYWSGKTDLIAKYWPNLLLYWNNLLSHVDAEGLWKTGSVFGDIRIGEHCPNDNCVSGLVMPWVIERLGMTIEMAQAINRTQQASHWKSTLARMISAFQQNLIGRKNGIPYVADIFYNDTLKGYSQAGQTVAIYTDLLSTKDAIADLKHAFPDPDGTPPDDVERWNNPTWSYRVFRALSHVGLTSKAIAHFKERYGRFLPGSPSNIIPPVFQGPHGGPLPEYAIDRSDLKLNPGDINWAQPVDDTGSHGWMAVSLVWVHEFLLGVTIADPGGDRININPDAGDLPYVKGYTNTPKGVVYVYWKPPLSLDVHLPKGVNAQICVPKDILRVSPTAQLVSKTSQNHSPQKCLSVSGEGAHHFEVVKM